MHKSPILKYKSNQNQIFYYTRWITPKRVTSWRGPSPRHCARATQLLSKKCRSGGEPLATLCRFDRPEIWTSDLPLQRRTRYSSTNYNIFINDGLHSLNNEEHYTDFDQTLAVLKYSINNNLIHNSFSATWLRIYTGNSSLNTNICASIDYDWFLLPQKQSKICKHYLWTWQLEITPKI